MSSWVTHPNCIQAPRTWGNGLGTFWLEDFRRVVAVRVLYYIVFSEEILNLFNPPSASQRTCRVIALGIWKGGYVEIAVVSCQANVIECESSPLQYRDRHYPSLQVISMCCSKDFKGPYWWEDPSNGFEHLALCQLFVLRRCVEKPAISELSTAHNAFAHKTVQSSCYLSSSEAIHAWAWWRQGRILGWSFWSLGCANFLFDLLVCLWITWATINLC